MSKLMSFKHFLTKLFLAATGQLYKRVCRSVGRSVGWSVRPSDLAFLASNFDISAVYGRIGLCFGYDAPLGLYYHTCTLRTSINTVEPRFNKTEGTG